MTLICVSVTFVCVCVCLAFRGDCYSLARFLRLLPVSAGDVFAPRVALLVALPHVNILLTPSLPWCDLKTTDEKGGIVNL